MLACKKCRTKLLAYVHHELAPLERRWISQHLDECETCYALYFQHQDMAQNLAQSVPLIGHGHQPALDRVWNAIQQDLVQPRHRVRTYPAHYGLAALAVTIMLLIPLTMGNQNLSLASPATQPSPLMQATPSSTESAESALIAPKISLTPRAVVPKIAVPSPDAITTP